MGDEIFGIVIILFVLIGSFIGRLLEKKDWNNGYCKKTYRKWQHFDTDSQGGRGYTDGLGNYCWISYGVDN